MDRTHYLTYLYWRAYRLYLTAIKSTPGHELTEEIQRAATYFESVGYTYTLLLGKQPPLPPSINH